MKRNQSVNKTLSFKDYIAKYIFLKILYGEYQVNTFIPSESAMAKHFATTNLTIRTAYNVLISLGILKPVKGKGYFVQKNSFLVLWSTYELLHKAKKEIKIISDYKYKIIFKNKKNNLNVISEFTTSKKADIHKKTAVLDIFKTILHLDVQLDFDIMTQYTIENLKNSFVLVEHTAFIDRKDKKQILGIKTYLTQENLRQYVSVKTLKI